ncbi:MAG: ketosteroid isomerase family protein [Leptolyngbyaceae cyanobacterium CAN_BIN12]|nr:ketosteroid isomerase family protein [Leptolyngbyaceae cyanobacterium CAN_BIN12]
MRLSFTFLFGATLMKNALLHTFSEAATNSSITTIEGIEEPTIFQYFETFNAGDFDATSQLFAREGMLQPPFEAIVTGSEAIAAYLQQEATGFIFLPCQGQKSVERGDLERDETDFLVLGRVQTPWFTVNVSWTFILNSNKQIILAKVNLLASLKELMHMRR